MDEQSSSQKVQKSTYWKVTIILSSIIAAGILGVIIWSVAVVAIFGKTQPSYVAWMDLVVRLALAILGIWYGVRYIAKKSSLAVEEATKIAVGVIVLPVIFAIGSALYQYFAVIPILPDLAWFIQNLIWVGAFFASTKYFVKKLASTVV